MDIEFEEFGDLLDFIYQEANEESPVRIEPPTDSEKLKIFYALEAYMILLMEGEFAGMESESDRDIWDDMIIP